MASGSGATASGRRPHRLHGRPVEPIWGGPKPHWLDEYGNLGGTIAVKNHGPAPFVFEEQRKTPLGVNMAVRRSLIEQIGGFRPDLGRNGKSLLGQEQADSSACAPPAHAASTYRRWLSRITCQRHA